MPPLADFEAVKIGRIVTAGDHHPAVGFKVVQGKIGNRRRDHAYVRDIASGRKKSLHQGVPKFDRTLAHVPADGEGFSSVPFDVRADGFADQLNGGRG